MTYRENPAFEYINQGMPLGVPLSLGAVLLRMRELYHPALKKDVYAAMSAGKLQRVVVFHYRPDGLNEWERVGLIKSPEQLKAQKPPHVRDADGVSVLREPWK